MATRRRAGVGNRQRALDAMRQQDMADAERRPIHAGGSGGTLRMARSAYGSQSAGGGGMGETGGQADSASGSGSDGGDGGSRSVAGGRGVNPGRGYGGTAAQPGGKGQGFGFDAPGGNIGAGASEARTRGVQTGLQLGTGIIGTLAANVMQGFRNQAIIGEVAEEFGLDRGALQAELGLDFSPDPTHEGGDFQDTVPGGYQEPPGEEEAEDEDEVNRNIRRGLAWYRGLVGQWAPGQEPI